MSESYTRVTVKWAERSTRYNTTMRIIYLLHQYFPRHIGGTEILARGLVRRAKASGHEVLVVTCHESSCSTAADFHVENTEFEGVSLKEIHFNLALCPQPSRNEYYNPYVGQVITEILKEFSPDVVHCLHPMKLTAAALDACTRAAIPLVVTLSDFWLICPRHSLLTWEDKLCSGPDKIFKCTACVNRLHGYPSSPQGLGDLPALAKDIIALERRSKILRRSILKAQKIFALSPFQKHILIENGYPAHRLELLTHGIEAEDLGAEMGKQANRSRVPLSVLRLGFIGNIVPIKGLHVLLAALKLVKHQVSLDVYGELRDDPYSRSIAATGSDLPSVTFHGPFAPNKLGEILEKLDALVVPSLWYENEPLVVKAAQYKKVALILSDIGSLSGMVENGVDGTLVAANDASAWAAVFDRACREQLPLPSAEKVKTVNENSAQLLKLYGQLVETNKR